MQALKRRFSQLMNSIVAGSRENHLQETDRHDQTNRNLFPPRHMKLRYAREWDEQEDEVVEHVDDPSCNEEFRNINAMSFGAAELEPEETPWSAKQAHAGPEINRV